LALKDCRTTGAPPLTPVNNARRAAATT